MLEQHTHTHTNTTQFHTMCLPWQPQRHMVHMRVWRQRASRALKQIHTSLPVMWLCLHSAAFAKEMCQLKLTPAILCFLWSVHSSSFSPTFPPSLPHFLNSFIYHFRLSQNNPFYWNLHDGERKCFAFYWIFLVSFSVSFQRLTKVVNVCNTSDWNFHKLFRSFSSI